MITRYEVLGVREDASEDEIRLAYRRLSIRYQPDKHPADPAHGPWCDPWPDRIMRLLNEARDTLVDPDLRAEYDERLRAWRSGQLAAKENATQQAAAAADAAQAQNRSFTAAIAQEVVNATIEETKNRVEQVGADIQAKLERWLGL